MRGGEIDDEEEDDTSPPSGLALLSPRGTWCHRSLCG